MNKLSLSICIFLGLNSCTENDGAIRVTCNDVESIQSGLGIINISQRSIGDIILLDTSIQSSFFISHIQIDERDISTTTIRDSMTLLSTSEMELQFEGDISVASENVKANVRSTIDNNTTFFLSNCIRKNITDPSAQINQIDPNYFSEHKAVLKKSPKYILAMVTSILYADKFEFRLKNQTNGEIGSNIIEVGSFKVSVSYACQNSIQINAKQDGIFYKVSYYTLGDDGELKFTPVSIDLTKYAMSQNYISCL